MGISLFKSDLQSVPFIKFLNKWPEGKTKNLTIVLDGSKKGKVPKGEGRENLKSSLYSPGEDCLPSSHLRFYSHVICLRQIIIFTLGKLVTG